jgi:hypothetical protein
VSWVLLAYHHSVRVTARATGTKPKDPPRRAEPFAPLTSFVRFAQRFFFDNHGQLLAVGTPSLLVDPQRSDSELHVLRSGM